MFQRLTNHYYKHLGEVHSSIKLIDIEEKFDLVFSRFFGLYLAKLGRKLNMTPTQVSILSMAVGLTGGLMLYYQDMWVVTVWASVLISLAGVLDSADGQLARMTGQSTELGRFIDGFVDSVIFIACYLAACTYYVQGDMGWSVFLIALPAGLVSHNACSIIYDFYKCEFLYYIADAKTSKVRTVEEAKVMYQQDGFWNRFFSNIGIDYTKRQWFLISRTEEMRETYESFAFNPATREKFIEKYRKTFNPIMFWWALIGGTNTHRTLIMVFSIMGRFDLYLIVLLFKLVPMAVVYIVQKVVDEDFHKQLQYELAATQNC